MHPLDKGVSGSSSSGQSETSVLKIFSKNAVASKQPKYSLRLFDYVDGKLGSSIRIGPDGQSYGDFPILSVAASSPPIWLPGSTKALVMRGMDSRTGQPATTAATSIVTDTTVSPARLDTSPIDLRPDELNPGVDALTGTGGAFRTGDISDPELRSRVESEFTSAQYKMGYKMEVVTLGMPDLLPADVVSVRGLGPRFDTNYGVFVVNHRIGTGGFTTQLTLYANTAKVLQAAVQATGPQNTKDPKSSDDRGKLLVSATSEDEKSAAALKNTLFQGNLLSSTNTGAVRPEYVTAPGAIFSK
jgi:hypothetical protein